MELLLYYTFMFLFGFFAGDAVFSNVFTAAQRRSWPLVVV